MRTFDASEEETEGARVAPPSTATAESIPIPQPSLSNLLSLLSLSQIK